MDMPEKNKNFRSGTISMFNKKSNKTKDEILSEYKFPKSTLLIFMLDQVQEMTNIDI